MTTEFDRADNLHRPPLGTHTTSTTRPLIVTPTFVSRVDDTPRGERPQDAGASKSRQGHEVHFPNWRPHALALEGAPNLAWEHWDEYWRKVHGPKFAWDEPGSSSALVLRYAQLHNIGSTQKDPEGGRIDAVSVLSFASLNDVEDYLVSAGHAAIEAAENALVGEGSEWWTGINYSVINRLVPELATEWR